MGKLEDHALVLLSYVSKHRFSLRGVGAFVEQCGIPRSSLMFLLRESEGKEILTKVARKYGFSFRILTISPYLIDAVKDEIIFE
jgi:hypothetical protein